MCDFDRLSLSLSLSLLATSRMEGPHAEPRRRGHAHKSQPHAPTHPDSIHIRASANLALTGSPIRPLTGIATTSVPAQFCHSPAAH